jgi:curved DNA-binding protein CbpA
MTQDHYEILQVHPKADRDAIAAAYARLSELYAPARLEGAAEELADLARQKRDAIELAYAVLGDPARRAAYDAELAALGTAEDRGSKLEDGRAPRHHPRSSILDPRSSSSPALDYRPLPPARRAERTRDFNAYPLRDAEASSVAKTGGRLATRPKAKRWVAPAVIAGLLAVVAAISVGVTGGATPPAPAAQATPTPSPLDAFEADIAAAQQTAQQHPTDSRAWIDYGNILYNSAEIVRENAPDSPLYEQRLPRWLEATQAYTRALAIEPGNAAVRADLGVSACFYGAGTGNQSFVLSGTAEARRASAAAPDDPRILLNLGHCLASTRPPQTQEAIAQWKRAVEVAPPGSPFAAQAQQLITQYGQ